MEICTTIYISEFTLVLYTILVLAPQRKVSREDNSDDLGAMRRDRQAQSNCFQMLRHLRTLCNEMAPHHVKTTFRDNHVRTHRHPFADEPPE